MTLCFWFAIHLEDLNLAQALLGQEFLLKQLVACALMNQKNAKEGDDFEESDEDSEEGDEWNINSQGKRGDNSNESFKSENFSEEEDKQDSPTTSQKH